jgi:hypothetical protein
MVGESVAARVPGPIGRILRDISHDTRIYYTHVGLLWGVSVWAWFWSWVARGCPLEVAVPLVITLFNLGSSAFLKFFDHDLARGGKRTA